MSLSGNAQFVGYISKSFLWDGKQLEAHCVTASKNVKFTGCGEGECCDLTTHYPKPAGSLPNGPSYEYICSSNKVIKRSYSCNGKDTYRIESDSTIDICGTCEYCSKGQSSCLNKDIKTSCGNGPVCDGSGNCVCLKEFDFKCYNQDIYWFDSCGNSGDKKEDCNSKGCNTLLNKCNNICSTCSSLDKQCGSWSDGCSGTLNCGICPTGQSCNSNGQCLCNSNCEDKQCGNDGCGGSCGTCSSSQTCNDKGQCIPNTPEPTLRRTSASSVTPNSNFIVTYSTSGVSGKWFVAWNDNITGGCTPTSYQAFMSSPSQGSSTNDQKVATFTAPSSGSCTFSGYYQYSGNNQKSFTNLIVAIGTCNTPADTNCDNIVSFDELISYASLWTNGAVSFDDLIKSANEWSS